MFARLRSLAPLALLAAGCMLAPGAGMAQEMTRLLDEGHDLSMFAAESLAEFHQTGDFRGETNAAGTVDAPGHVGRNQRPEILVANDALFLFVTGLCPPVADGKILKLALPTLVTDWTIQRVIDEQELHHTFARLDDLLAKRVDLHSLFNRGIARRLELGYAFDFDEADAAHADDRQF